MAIIRREPAAETGLEAIILGDERPAYKVRDGKIIGEASGQWRDALAACASIIETATLATGRIEPADTSLVPFSGTAFVVGPKLAATARHVAETLTRRDPNAEGLAELANGNTINFLEGFDSNTQYNVAIEKICLSHPCFNFALLTLAEEIPSPRRLLLSSASPKNGGNIFCVGFPALDQRNESRFMTEIFGFDFGIKRVMPGIVMSNNGISPSYMKDDNIPCLTHDASTLGGCGGGPIVDMETGHVVGINFAGQYLVGNYAAPAWELARDPYVRLAKAEFYDGPLPPWIDLWTPEARAKIIKEKKNSPFYKIFTQDQLKEIHRILIRADLSSNEYLRVLTTGIDVELVAQCSISSKPTETILSYLDLFNECERYEEGEGHTPFYLFLTRARAVRSALPNFVAECDKYIGVIEQAENEVRQQIRSRSQPIPNGVS